MNLSHPEMDYTREIDSALAVLGSVQPRDGLEQRVLARIAVAPTAPWYQRFMVASAGQHRWMLAAASALIVAGGATMSVYHYHVATPAPLPVAIHAPHPTRQAAAAAAGIGVSRHPLQSNTVRTRHRGIRRSYRATHERTPLPRGAAAPRHPQTFQLPR